LPLLKVTGELPNIDIKIAGNKISFILYLVIFLIFLLLLCLILYIIISENRILDALSVFLSVPFPNKTRDFDDNPNVCILRKLS